MCRFIFNTIYHFGCPCKCRTNMELSYNYVTWQRFMGTVKMKAISSCCQVGECMFVCPFGLSFAHVSVYPWSGTTADREEAQERHVLLSAGKRRVLLSGSVGAYLVVCLCWVCLLTVTVDTCSAWPKHMCATGHVRPLDWPPLRTWEKYLTMKCFMIIWSTIKIT